MGSHHSKGQRPLSDFDCDTTTNSLRAANSDQDFILHVILQGQSSSMLDDFVLCVYMMVEASPEDRARFLFNIMDVNKVHKGDGGSAVSDIPEFVWCASLLIVVVANISVR